MYRNDTSMSYDSDNQFNNEGPVSQRQFGIMNEPNRTNIEQKYQQTRKHIEIYPELGLQEYREELNQVRNRSFSTKNSNQKIKSRWNQEKYRSIENSKSKSKSKSKSINKSIEEFVQKRRVKNQEYKQKPAGALRDKSLRRKDVNDETEMMNEIINLKSQYLILKQSYNKLICEKLQINNIMKKNQDQIERLKANNMKQEKDIHQYKSQISHLEAQLIRITKQSCKLLELETYKMKKLEENIKEKERIIASRNQSSLSYEHQNFVYTEMKDQKSRMAPIYSHRNLYVGFNTEEQKDREQEQNMGTKREKEMKNRDLQDVGIINRFKRDHSTVQHLIDKSLRRFKRGSSQSSMNIIITNCQAKQNKKHPFQTINNYKSGGDKPDKNEKYDKGQKCQKKKRSITNKKLNSGKKNTANGKATTFLKLKKTDNSVRY